MNVLIIYFSQTGNTEKIAKTIAEGIAEAGNRCDLVKIKQVDASTLAGYDLVGLGTPTFFYREPRNIRVFLAQLDPENIKSKHWFLFCTHGSIIGNTFFHMAEQLRGKGATVIGAYDCYGSSSLQFYPRPMHTEGHPDEIAVREAKQFGKSICATCDRIQNGQSDLVPSFERIDDIWWAQQSENLTPELFRAVSPPLTVNPDLCNQCLLCQEECPVDAIDIEADPPEIQKQGCIYCWYCEKMCPLEAIEADWTDFARGARSNLAKYVRELQKAEDEGKFRPQLDYKKIV